MGETRKDTTVTTTVTLEIPSEIARDAEGLAKRMQARPEAFLTRCLADGMADQSLDMLFDPASSATAHLHLTIAQQAELIDLLGRREEGLSNTDYFRLDELLRLYRQSLVRKAQAVTDWLAAGGSELSITITQLTRFDSSMLYAAGYDPNTETLEVVFNTGGIYRYSDVPPDVYEGLVASESKGRYMWTHVLNLYPYDRLRRDRA